MGEKPEDEQLHVLPHYAPDFTDEFDSPAGQNYKAIAGQVEFLEKFERKLVKRSAPKKSSCKRGHPTPQRKKFLDNLYKISKNNTSSMNMKQAVEEATFAMNSPSPSKKSPMKRMKKINKSESNQQQKQQPLGNVGMPLGQQQQHQPVLIPNQNAQNIQNLGINIHHQNMGKMPLGNIGVPSGNINLPLGTFHQFNSQSQPTSISIQANHVTVLPPNLPSMSLFYKNHQNMGQPLGINMPLSPPSSVQEDDLNLLLQEGLNTTPNPEEHFPNAYYGNIGGQLDGHVSPIPQLDGITEDQQIRVPAPVPSHPGFIYNPQQSYHQSQQALSNNINHHQNMGNMPLGNNIGVPSGIKMPLGLDVKQNQMSWPNTDFSLQYPLTPQSSISSSPVASPVKPIGKR